MKSKIYSSIAAVLAILATIFVSSASASYINNPEVPAELLK
jgi:cyclic lactone autoinducer peptide